MAAPERTGVVARGSTSDPGQAVCSRTLLHPQATSVTESGCVVPERLLEDAAGQVRGKRLDQVPQWALGKEAGKAAEEVPAGPHSVEAAVSPQDKGKGSSPALPSPPAALARGFSPAASGSALGSLPPVSGILHNAAQQLQNVAQRVALQQGRSGEAAVALTRLLPPKQLETLCVQIQPEKTKEKDKSPLGPAVVHPRSVTITQSVEKNSKVLGLGVTPQIIQIHPAMGTESQQFFLHNSSEPTVQLLLHSTLHPLGQISIDKITTHRQKNKPAVIAPADSPNGTLISTNLLINHEKKQKDQKIKKSLKVKTRSGRISRPPKYKAKDYKFIKTEDLADCHQSDSDDYSELSLEDDEGGKETGKYSLFDSLEYDLRPKLFKCQSCDKSYIGQGGLARHYKLNPDHGQQEPSQSSLISRPHRKTSLECTGKRSENTHHSFLPPPIDVALINKNGIDIELEKDLKESERQFDTSAEDRKSAEQLSSCLLHSGRGRARQPRRRGQPKWTERSRYSGRFSRPDQFTSRCHNNMSSKHHSIFRRKARLNELTEQCANEDFMELAVPRFTKLVTVFEFLLMKVEQKYQKRALFPEVYREFEELHAVVKKMCQDYFGNPELNKSVEIKNPKVAESLGITDSFLVVQKTQADSSPVYIKTTDDHVFTEIVGQKRATESSDEMLPLPKKSRVEFLVENMNINYSNHSGKKEGSSTYEEENCAADVQSGNALWEEEHELLEKEIANDQAGLDLYDQSTQMRFESMQPSRKSELDCSGCLSSWGETLPTDRAVSSEEKLMQAGSSWGTGSEVTLSSGSP